MTTRTPLRRDLTDLKQKVYSLGEKCIEVSELYNSLLENYSNNLKDRLTAISQEVKKESKNLNDQCFLVLTLQQPLIKDLRLVVGSLQIVLSFEKITEQYLSTLSLLGDVNILEESIKIQFITMAKKVQELIKTALTLYLSANINQSDEALKRFSEISCTHDILYKHILKQVGEKIGHTAQIEAQLLATIRSLEKVSDLTINIIEQVKYIIVGKNESSNI